MANPTFKPTVANPFMPSAVPAAVIPNVALPGKGEDVFEVDLTDVKSGFIIPDSMYMVKCIDVEQGVSNAGNPQYIWTFVITQGEFAGREFKLFTALTPAALWKVAETVVALGVGESGQSVKFRKTDVVNKECVAVIEKSTYNGNERSQIVRVMTLAAAQAK